MLLVAWIGLMWAQFYTESFAFVSKGSMYRLATKDTDPSTIHSPVYFAARHYLCSGPCHASRCCQGCIAVEYILQNVANALNIPAHNLRCSHNGTYLQPEQPLADYSIQDNVIIDVMPRMYGGGGIDCRDPENIDVLKDRFASLSAVSTIWFPLTLDIGEPTL